MEQPGCLLRGLVCPSSPSTLATILIVLLLADEEANDSLT
jgi:hypothetical protein